MKKGFTLLELLIVVIIIGVLAALGLNQYSRTIEKSRSSEARNMIGQVRTIASAYYQGHGTIIGLTPAMCNVGSGVDQLPDACRDDHFFYISLFQVASDTKLELTATRCGATGKGGANPFSGSFVDGNLDFPGEIETWNMSPVYQ